MGNVARLDLELDIACIHCDQYCNTQQGGLIQLQLIQFDKTVVQRMENTWQRQSNHDDERIDGHQV